LHVIDDQINIFKAKEYHEIFQIHWRQYHVIDC